MPPTIHQHQGYAFSRKGHGTWSSILAVGGSAMKLYFSSLAEKSLSENEIHLAENGIEGLSMLDMLGHSPELLFLNVFMPHMDGIEFLGALSKRNYRGNLVLVEDANEGMLNVANDYARALGLNVRGVFYTAQLDAINWTT